MNITVLQIIRIHVYKRSPDFRFLSDPAMRLSAIIVAIKSDNCCGNRRNVGRSARLCVFQSRIFHTYIRYSVYGYVTRRVEKRKRSESENRLRGSARRPNESDETVERAYF